MEESIILQNVYKKFNIGKTKSLSNIFNKNKKTENAFYALSDISFKVSKGEILGIIGLNGSGKTTLMRIIAGVYLPDEGNVTVNGKIAPLMQLGSGFSNELDAKDNIILNGMLLGLSKKYLIGKFDEIIKFAGISNFVNLKLKHYSSGMRSRLAFAISMQIDSEIFLIDEILSVGDREFQKKSYNTILDLKSKNKTIIHTTHNLKKLSDFSDRVIVLNKGKIVIDDLPEKAIKIYKGMKSSLE